MYNIDETGIDEEEKRDGRAQAEGDRNECMNCTFISLDGNSCGNLHLD